MVVLHSLIYSDLKLIPPFTIVGFDADTYIHKK